MTMEGISSKALAFGSPKNKKGYAGNELQKSEFSDGLGLELYDFNARTYDHQTGRFIQIDPLTDEGGQESLSPFHYSYNNPITFSDPDDKFPILVPVLIWLAGLSAETVATVTVVAATTTVVAAATADGINNNPTAGTGTYRNEFYATYGDRPPPLPTFKRSANKSGSAARSAKAAVPKVAETPSAELDYIRGSYTNLANANSAGSGANPHKTSRAARRDAMRQEGVPTSQQPTSQKRNSSGRTLEYDVPTPGGGKGTKQAQQQTKDRNHGPHWEVGTPKTDPSQTNPYGQRRLQNNKSKSYYEIPGTSSN